VCYFLLQLNCFALKAPWYLVDEERLGLHPDRLREKLPGTKRKMLVRGSLISSG